MSFGRKTSLILMGTAEIQGPDLPPTVPPTDLANFHFKFSTVQADVETPNNLRLRVYNLDPRSINAITGAYSRVVLQAGYAESFGVIFDGTIKQFGIGKENETDSYLDILAADGDQAYNFSVVNVSLEAPLTGKVDQIKKAAEAMGPLGVELGFIDNNGLIGGTVPNPRGKVMFGMTRRHLRNLTDSVSATWSIQNGKISVIPLDGYLPNEPIVLSSANGMVGIPEQQIDGIKIKNLLDPRLVPGQLVKIDNNSINKVIAADPKASPFQNFPFDKRVALPVLLATVANDGLYRIYVAEYEGDTRGGPWYVNLTCLAVNATTGKVKPYG